MARVVHCRAKRLPTVILALKKTKQVDQFFSNTKYLRIQGVSVSSVFQQKFCFCCSDAAQHLAALDWRGKAHKPAVCLGTIMVHGIIQAALRKFQFTERNFIDFSWKFLQKEDSSSNIHKMVSCTVQNNHNKPPDFGNLYLNQ